MTSDATAAGEGGAETPTPSRPQTQNFGVLVVVCGPDLTVVQVSDNAASLLDVPAAALLGMDADAVLDRASVARIRAAAASTTTPADALTLSPADEPVRVQTLHGRRCDAIVRVFDGRIVLEMEPATGNVAAPALFLRAALRIHRVPSSAQAWTTAAEEIRLAAGYDHVYVYRLPSPSWAGQGTRDAQVLACSSRTGSVPPLADPLVVEDAPLLTAAEGRAPPGTSLRVVAGPHEDACALLRAEGEPPLALDACLLRASTLAEQTRLRAHGVCAMLEVPMLDEAGTLWGTVLCHHRTPRAPIHAVRQGVMLLAQTLSSVVASRLREETAMRLAAARQVELQIVQQMNAAAHFRDGLCTAPLLDLVHADGAAVVVEGELLQVGLVPDAGELARIASRLRTSASDEVFLAEHLPTFLDEADTTPTAFRSMLALRVSPSFDDYVFWFRKPRQSAAPWTQPATSGRHAVPPHLRDGESHSVPWTPSDLEAARSLRVAILEAARRRAAQLASMNEGLIAADRAKDMFLAAVSHELRTPLHAILGWAQRLQRADLSPEKAARALDIIVRNATFQNRLVDDLLDVARMAEGKLVLEPVLVQLAPLAQHALDSVAPSLDATRVEVAADLDGDAWVFGDARRLQQVISNLLANALKFTPAGGRVDLTVHQSSEAVMLEVRDTGVGFPSRDAERLFEPFWQVRDSLYTRKGLGLGLSIVRALVEMHGGSVHAASEGTGKGATFVVSLPRAR